MTAVKQNNNFVYRQKALWLSRKQNRTPTAGQILEMVANIKTDNL